MSQSDFDHYSEVDDYNRETIATPYCGVCGTQMIMKSDSYYPEKVWLHCAECKEAIERNADLESLNAALEEKWLKAERMYLDLQAHISALLL